MFEISCLSEFWKSRSGPFQWWLEVSGCSPGLGCTPGNSTISADDDGRVLETAAWQGLSLLILSPSLVSLMECSCRG